MNFQYLDPHTRPEDVYGLKISHGPYDEFVYHPHDHNFCEFSLITYGTCLHIVNSQVQILPEHTLSFVRDKDVHYYKRFDKNENRKYNLGIPNDILYQAISYYRIDPEFIFSPEYPFVIHLSLKDYYNLLEKLVTFHNSDFGPAHGVLFLSIVSDVIYLLLKSDSRPSNFQKMPAWFSNLLFAIESPENFTVGIEKLKSLSNYSIEHINRCFKKYLNVTPTEYINRLRIEHAAKLLVEKPDNIINIGYLSVFKNEGYFYKKFKEYYNMTPNEFAKTYRE